MINNLNKIRIIMADDHILLRDTLASFINGFEEFEVIALASNGHEVINQFTMGNVPDILLLDLNMPEMNGYEAAKIIYRKYPDVKVLALTMYDNELTLIRLLQVGVKGFLKKDMNPFELKQALILVNEGQYYYGNQAMDKLSGIVRNSNEHSDLLKRNILTDTEIQFLRLCSSDLTYKEIASQMNMTPRRVDHFRDHLFEKLDVKSRVGLAMYAMNTGLTVF